MKVTEKSGTLRFRYRCAKCFCVFEGDITREMLAKLEAYGIIGDNPDPAQVKKREAQREIPYDFGEHRGHPDEVARHEQAPEGRDGLSDSNTIEPSAAQSKPPLARFWQNQRDGASMQRYVRSTIRELIEGDDDFLSQRVIAEGNNWKTN